MPSVCDNGSIAARAGWHKSSSSADLTGSACFSAPRVQCLVGWRSPVRGRDAVHRTVSSFTGRCSSHSSRQQVNNLPFRLPRQKTQARTDFAPDTPPQPRQSSSVAPAGLPSVGISTDTPQHLLPSRSGSTQPHVAQTRGSGRVAFKPVCAQTAHKNRCRSDTKGICPSPAALFRPARPSAGSRNGKRRVEVRARLIRTADHHKNNHSFNQIENRRAPAHTAVVVRS